MTRFTRRSVSLRPRDEQRLDELQAEYDLSKNDVIRRAIAADWYLSKQRREGRRILIETEDGTLREVEFIE